MTKQEVKKRIEKLKKIINYHRYLYHVLDRQEISESALDSLKKELFDLEQKFPEFGKMASNLFFISNLIKPNIRGCILNYIERFQH